MNDYNSPFDRRGFLKTAGATVTVAAFAGCAGDDNGDAGGSAPPGDGDDLVEMDGFSVPRDNVAPSSELSGDQEIRELELIVNPPDATPNDYETCEVIAEAASELGLDIEVNTMTWSAQSEAVWDGRDWDMTFWEMVGRPSRLDPDEFLYQMFHTDRMNGYNYYFWDGGDYDDVVENQRQEVDEDTRQPIVHECQEIIHERGPSTFILYPENTFAWNSDEWEGVVDLSGMGVVNPISFSQMQSRSDDETLVLSYDTEIQNINPFNQSGEVDMIQHRMLWDRLVWPNEDALPSPRLATELNWIDDTTLEVPFIEGHQFHDGTEVLAEDVKYSFEIHDTSLDHGWDTWFTAAVEPIENIEIVDDYRVRFNLEYSFAPFLMATLGRIAIVSKQYWEDRIETMDAGNIMDDQEEEPMGSGPMEFEHWRRDEEVSLTRYDDHFDPIDYDGRVTRIIPSVQTTLSQLEEGTVDMLGIYGGDQNVLEDRVNDSDHLSLQSTVSAGFKQVSYNNEKAPFHIDAFRRAMNHRTNKELIVEQIFDGWGDIPPNSPTSSALGFWHNSDLEHYAFDLQAAANELIEAGFMWDEEEGRLHMPADQTEAPTYDA